MIVSRGLSAALLLLIVKTAAADDDSTVVTPLGKLRGRWLTSRAGRKYMAFSGVPYAKPPVGDLRFKAPVAADPWTGIREAKEDGPMCIQYLLTNTTGVEDCLYLSVSTTNITKKAPVLVMLHGGGFIMGTGNFTLPSYLMDEDVVVVNVNYRLGIFGFLTFETNDLPGNQGLKDQTMALKWVQQNIASFGGDPNKVTIHGYSAGGSSVYNHYVSPLSKGLFHRGYAMSGTSYNPWALSPPGLARTNAEKLMKLIGCPTTPQEAIPCVMKKDAKEIVDNFPHFLVELMDPILTFSPVLEEPGPEAFLVSPISKWELSPAPLIISLSSAEGLYRAIKSYESMDQFSQNFDKTVPDILNYWASASHPEIVTKKVKEFYFPGKTELTKKDYVNLTHMVSDGLMAHGIIEGANKAKGEVYFLYMDYIPKSAIPKGQEMFYEIGANHCGELPFLWEVIFMETSKIFLQTEADIKLSKEIVKTVAEFMETGNAKIPSSGLEWKTWTPEHSHYLHLDKNGFTLKEGLLQDRFKFWDTVNYKDNFN